MACRCTRKAEVGTSIVTMYAWMASIYNIPQTPIADPCVPGTASTLPMRHQTTREPDRPPREPIRKAQVDDAANLLQVTLSRADHAGAWQQTNPPYSPIES
jgi:hypothetical protein